MHPLLQINNLEVSFSRDGSLSRAVNGISLSVERGRITAIVGESGSGKSVTALSVLQLLPPEARQEGSVLFSSDGDQQLEMNRLDAATLNSTRGNKAAMIFQEPMTSLNPVLTCGSQVIETIMRHQKISRREAKEKTIRLFKEVELPDPAAMVNRYPHQLSGGQKQRVMIAMAMCCEPKLLIADEPTTALDVLIQKNILQLIKTLQHKNNMGVLLITHDLGIVADIADDIIVMHKGCIIEKGPAADILKDPQQPYTKALLACRPAAGKKGERLPVISDFMETKNGSTIITGKPLYKKAEQATPILSVQNLEVSFPAAKNIFGRPVAFTKAVDGVSFDIMKGEITGLVGESGCGKTTLGRAILQLTRPTSGKIFLHGKELTSMHERDIRHTRKDMQIIFQDPYGSLNPGIRIGDAILEALKVHGVHGNNNERKEAVVDMLEKVQLDADHYKRYPHQFSGGQRQRVCIARALVLDPSFLVFDESVSALDVSVQAGILNLVNELKSSLDFTALFISHDLAVVHYISDRIMVMNKGKIIESGNAGDIYHHPREEYTKQLINAIPGKNFLSKA